MIYEINKFKYLGIIITSEDIFGIEIRSSIGQAKVAFDRLKISKIVIQFN